MDQDVFNSSSEFQEPASQMKAASQFSNYQLFLRARMMAMALSLEIIIVVNSQHLRIIFKIYLKHYNVI
jgi:hypothetical protein